MKKPSEEQAATLDVQEKTLARQLDWIRAIDSKVQFTMAISLAMVGALASLSPKPEDITIKHGVLFLIGVIPPAMSVVFCYQSTFPQFEGPENSLVFFGDIALRNLKDYEAEIKGREVDSYIDDLNTQCWINAKIATFKYKHVRLAMKSLKIGVIPFVVCAALLYYWGHS